MKSQKKLLQANGVMDKTDLINQLQLDTMEMQFKIELMKFQVQKLQHQIRNQMKLLQMKLYKVNGEMVQKENQDFKQQDMIIMQYKQSLIEN